MFLKVSDITEEAMIARELALIKSSNISSRAELYSLIEPFRAAVIDVGKDSHSCASNRYAGKSRSIN